MRRNLLFLRHPSLASILFFFSRIYKFSPRFQIEKFPVLRIIVILSVKLPSINIVRLSLEVRTDILKYFIFMATKFTSSPQMLESKINFYFGFLFYARVIIFFFSISLLVQSLRFSLSCSFFLLQIFFDQNSFSRTRFIFIRVNLSL